MEPEKTGLKSFAPLTRGNARKAQTNQGDSKDDSNKDGALEQFYTTVGKYQVKNCHLGRFKRQPSGLREDTLVIIVGILGLGRLILPDET